MPCRLPPCRVLHARYALCFTPPPPMSSVFPSHDVYSPFSVGFVISLAAIGFSLKMPPAVCRHATGCSPVFDAAANAAMFCHY